MSTKDKILGWARAGEKLKTSSLSKRLRISRQTTADHLRKLVARGLLVKTGSTRNAVYAHGDSRTSKPPKGNVALLFKRTKGLEEHIVFEEIARKLSLKSKVPPNVHSIASYALTEMVNNAIDHSRSRQVRITAKVEGGKFLFTVRDWGIGVFRNVQRSFRLPNEFSALEHVLKGKQTTMPERHSGEGIYFTSRIADEFVLRSHKLTARVDNEVDDTFVREQRSLKGTEVTFSVKQRSKKKLEELFRAHTDDRLGFDKNVVRVGVSLAGGALSRSQARRLLAGLEKFKRLKFDFRGVKEIGQAFADEIFRVFPTGHQGVEVTYQNAVPAVDFMIQRVKRPR